MTLTALDTKTALIVIDLQKGLAAYPTVHPISDIVANAAALADAFRTHDLPVVLVNVVGRPPGRSEEGRMPSEVPPDFADLMPELKPQPRDIVISKRTAGAFTNTDLDAQLKQLGVTQTVIVGVSTSMGVEMTARHAFELGFNVALARDAMTDVSAEAHTNSLVRVFPRLGEIGTTHEIIAALDHRA